MPLVAQASDTRETAQTQEMPCHKKTETKDTDDTQPVCENCIASKDILQSNLSITGEITKLIAPAIITRFSEVYITKDAVFSLYPSHSPPPSQSLIDGYLIFHSSIVIIA